MKRKILSIALSIILSLALFNNISFAKENYNQNAIDNSKLQGYALFVPAGITCSCVLSTEINSKSAVIGQVINAVLVEDFIYNNKTIAKAGSIIGGTIISNRKAGFGNRNAKMEIRFTTIRTPYNNVIPISAVIVTKDSSGILKGGTIKDSTKDYAKNVAVGAASGALMGTITGAISDSTVGKGALVGTAVGAGIGLIKGITNKGDNIVIPSNSQITIFFDQPITLGAQ